MRFTILLLTLLLTGHWAWSQSLDNATKNKVKVMYLTADDYYKNGKFQSALSTIEEIEPLLKGQQLPTLQNLKVKSFIGAGQYTQAKKELAVLQAMNLSDAIIQDMARYSVDIDEKLKQQEEAKVARELAKQKELERQRQVEIENRARQKQQAEAAERQRLAKLEKERQLALAADKEKQAMELKIKNQLKYADFNEGLAMVTYDNKVGYVNEEGQIVIPLIYEDGAPFHEGLANVKQNKEWGFIDTRGQVIIGFNYRNCSRFFNGVCLADHINQTHFLNKEGKILNNNLNITYYGRSAEKGSFVLKTAFPGSWGVTSYQGEVIVPLQYKRIESVDNGYYIVLTYEKSPKFGVFDEAGNIVIPIQYDNIAYTGNGQFWVKDGNKYKLFDDKGESVSPVHYEYVSAHKRYNELREKGRLGIMDKSNKLLVPCEYNSVDLIHCQKLIFAILLKKKWGVIDSLGNVLIPPKYDGFKYAYNEFNSPYTHLSQSSNLVALALNKKWGFVDISNQRELPFLYEEVKAFSDGLAAVQLNGKWGFINESGQLVVNNRFNTAESFYKGLAIVQLGNEYRVINSKGETVISHNGKIARDYHSGIIECMDTNGRTTAVYGFDGEFLSNSSYYLVNSCFFYDYSEKNYQ